VHALHDVGRRSASAPPGLKVLVIDDNVDAADSLAMLLEALGHDVRTANDGATGLRVASAHMPSVVFCDIGMAGLDGYEVARRLRQDAACAGATIVAVTGWGGPEDKGRSEDAGFDLHLTKPIDATSVEAILESRSCRIAG
jgi:CheY-like chemotaxis protein